VAPRIIIARAVLMRTGQIQRIGVWSSFKEVEMRATTMFCPQSGFLPAFMARHEGGNRQASEVARYVVTFLPALEK
jgi:hypothetical protein